MFRVEWIQEAMDELAAIWVQAGPDLRLSVTGATHALDHELQHDPYANSESREDDNRVAIVFPLGIEFEVDPGQRIVWVLHVWQIRRGREFQD